MWLTTLNETDAAYRGYDKFSDIRYQLNDLRTFRSITDYLQYVHGSSLKLTSIDLSMDINGEEDMCNDKIEAFIAMMVNQCTYHYHLHHHGHIVLRTFNENKSIKTYKCLIFIAHHSLPYKHKSATTPYFKPVAYENPIELNWQLLVGDRLCNGESTAKVNGTIDCGIHIKRDDSKTVDDFINEQFGNLDGVWVDGHPNIYLDVIKPIQDKSKHWGSPYNETFYTRPNRRWVYNELYPEHPEACLPKYLLDVKDLYDYEVVYPINYNAGNWAIKPYSNAWYKDITNKLNMYATKGDSRSAYIIKGKLLTQTKESRTCRTNFDSLLNGIVKYLKEKGNLAFYGYIVNNRIVTTGTMDEFGCLNGYDDVRYHLNTIFMFERTDTDDKQLTEEDAGELAEVIKSIWHQVTHDPCDPSEKLVTSINFGPRLYTRYDNYERPITSSDTLRLTKDITEDDRHRSMLVDMCHIDNVNITVGDGLKITTVK